MGAARRFLTIPSFISLVSVLVHVVWHCVVCQYPKRNIGCQTKQKLPWRPCVGCWASVRLELRFGVVE